MGPLQSRLETTRIGISKSGVKMKKTDRKKKGREKKIKATVWFKPSLLLELYLALFISLCSLSFNKAI